MELSDIAIDAAARARYVLYRALVAVVFVNTKITADGTFRGVLK